MPAKQTKESIEAELNESEKDRAVRKLRDVAQGALEMEKRLEEREAELGLPTFYRSRPLVERMAAIGMSQDVIDHAKIWLDALSKIVSGRGDELPGDLKRELAEVPDAELTGAELLADIVRKHPKA